MKFKINLKNIFLNLLVLFAALIIIFPIFWIFLMSLKSSAQVMEWPPIFIFEPTLDNYKVLFDISVAGSSNYGTIRINFFEPILNSVIISGGAVLVSLIIGIPAGYILARSNFKFKEDIGFFILGFRFAPLILVIIPMFYFFTILGIKDTYFGMIWVYQVITLPMIIWLTRVYVEDIPIELEEAAFVDGASVLHVIYKIILPLLRPGLVGASLLVFLLAWHNFALGLLLASKKAPVTVALLKLLNPGINFYPVMACGLVISMIVPILLIFLGQKHFVKGLTFGAVK